MADFYDLLNTDVSSAGYGSGYNFPSYAGAGDGYTYDSMGNVVPVGSPAAASADPSGLAQAQLDLNASLATPSSFASLIKSIFDPTTLGGVAGLASLAALAGKSSLFNAPPTRVGYQGGIPQMTATRTQTPVAEQRPAGYRPGQGGITYFNPIQYALTPKPATTNPDQGATDQPVQAAAGGGISDLAKGRFLRGGGDGVSDSIPARFAGSGQEARLADNEFVIPARVVAELGNGSSEAGARKLYAMLDRVERAAKKAKRGQDSHADKYLPA